MKISFVTQWYDPEEGSAAIPGGIVRALEARGHEVQVITGFPNYPHGVLYPGYRLRWRAHERIGNTPVTRIPLFPSHDRSPVRRAANFLSFGLSASTLGAWLARRSEVVLVYFTSATVGMAAVVLGRVFRRPVLLLIQDLWPDTVIATGMLPAGLTRPASWVLGKMCGWSYSASSRIAVISPGLKDLLVERGVPAEKIDVVYNWVDETNFRPVDRRPSGEAFEVMYAGNLGDVQGLEVAVEAISLVRDIPDVVLRMVGAGVAKEALAALSERLGVVERVRFEGTRELSEMPQVLASADVQLVSLKDLPMFRVTMPSKMQAILASGLPAIVAAPGDAATLAQASGAAVVVPPGDAQALADAIREMHALSEAERLEMGARGRRFYESELAAAVGAARLEDALVCASRERVTA